MVVMRCFPLIDHIVLFARLLTENCNHAASGRCLLETSIVKMYVPRFPLVFFRFVHGECDNVLPRDIEPGVFIGGEPLEGDVHDAEQLKSAELAGQALEGKPH